MTELGPSIAVVVTCYNYAAYVGSAIESVLNQTVPFSEIVIVDDGSNDGSVDVISGYGPPVRLIEQTNSGQVSASLTGLRAVKSDYVYFLDADDMANPDLVATLLPLVTSEPAKIQFSVEAVDEHGVPTGSVFPSFPEDYSTGEMVRDNVSAGFYICPPTSGNVYKRSLLIDMDLGRLDARDSTDGTPVMVMPYLGAVITVARPLAKYRIHGSNHSQWHVATPELLAGEIARFERRWLEACAVLGRAQPPFGPRRPAFVVERELMISALGTNRVRVRDSVELVARLHASFLPARQKLVMYAWALLILVPSRTWRVALVKMRRAPGARPPLVRAAARVLGVAGSRRDEEGVRRVEAQRHPLPTAVIAAGDNQIVVVAKHVPWPPNSGDKWRTLGVVRSLTELGHVTVCAFEGDDDDAGPLRAEGIDVRSVPRRKSLLGLLQGLVLGRSITTARFWDTRLMEQVRLACESPVDVVVIEHIQLLPYLVRSRARVTVLDMHNIESLLTDRFGSTSRGVRRAVMRLEARALARLESRADVDTIALVSDLDRDRLPASSLNRAVVVVPNAWHEPEPLEAATEPIASFVALLSWGPNVDAAVWFARHVWPLVTAEVVNARLQLVGRNPAPAVRALSEVDGSVVVTGTVDDVRPYYAASRVALAPLLAGGGSRLKILEALAYGRPVVATTIGAEGLEDLIGRGVVVGDSPAALAGHVVELLRTPEVSEALGKAGAAAVRTDHGWNAATRPLIQIVRDQLEESR